jgi:serine protease Do
MWQRWKGQVRGRSGRLAQVLAGLLVGGVLGLMLGVGGGWVGQAAARPAVAPMAAAPAGAPTSFADLAAQLEPTVVNIRVTKVERVTGPGIVGPGGQLAPGVPFDEFFKQFFGDMPQVPREYKQQGAGSGFIIRKDGLIVTNNHVIEGAKEIKVTLADKEEYPAKVIGRDP